MGTADQQERSMATRQPITWICSPGVVDSVYLQSGCGRTCDIEFGSRLPIIPLFLESSKYCFPHVSKVFPQVTMVLVICHVKKAFPQITQAHLICDCLYIANFRDVKRICEKTVEMILLVIQCRFSVENSTNSLPKHKKVC